jgi:hypothetical protein
MSTYETHIGNVDNSTFAIGENARAQGTVHRRDRDDLVEAVGTLLSIVTRYTDPAAVEVQNLALAARREISAEKPRKEPFRRLTEAAQKLMGKLGSSLIEAGALADAVGKISDVIHHL